MRAKLIEKYPDVMDTEYPARRPNEAVYHAEANTLMRAARDHGGSLAGRTIEISVDRKLCPSCETVLPPIGMELGNPTVRLRDTTGRVNVMRDGKWMD